MTCQKTAKSNSSPRIVELHLFLVNLSIFITNVAQTLSATIGKAIFDPEQFRTNNWQDPCWKWHWISPILIKRDNFFTVLWNPLAQDSRQMVSEVHSEEQWKRNVDFLANFETHFN